MDMRERSGSHLRERSDEGSVRSVAMINRMTETEPQGFRQHNLPWYENQRPLSQFVGAARPVIYARRRGAGARAPRGLA